MARRRVRVSVGAHRHEGRREVLRGLGVARLRRNRHGYEKLISAQTTRTPPFRRSGGRGCAAEGKSAGAEGRAVPARAFCALVGAFSLGAPRGPAPSATGIPAACADGHAGGHREGLSVWESRPGKRSTGPKSCRGVPPWRKRALLAATRMMRASTSCWSSVCVSGGERVSLVRGQLTN